MWHPCPLAHLLPEYVICFRDIHWYALSLKDPMSGILSARVQFNRQFWEVPKFAPNHVLSFETCLYLKVPIIEVVPELVYCLSNCIPALLGGGARFRGEG